MNERLILEGKWDCGTFYYGAVAAYNVADIKLSFEPSLSHYQAKRFLKSKGMCETVDYKNEDTNGIEAKLGDELGEFKLGSTIVLLFEAPADGFKWEIKVDESVRLGQILGRSC